MASLRSLIAFPVEGPLGAPPRSLRFDYAVGVLAFLSVCGLGIDGWTHRHLMTDAFFTPAHALMYGAVSLLAAVFFIETFRNLRRGYALTQLLPPGYMISLLGVCGAGIGVPLDFLWHLIHGSELSIAALLSPTHLFIAISISLALSGPLRAGLIAQAPPRLNAQGPMLLSAAAILMTLQFFTQYAIAFDAGFSKSMAPIGYQYVTTSGNLAQLTTLYYRNNLAFFEIVLRAILLGGFIVFIVRSIRLAGGAFTTLFLLGLPTIFIMVANDPATYLINALTALGGGVFADILYHALRPYQNESRFRIFAPFVLGVYFALFFVLEAALGGGLWWDANLVAGAVATPMIIGFLLSLLASPPVMRTSQA